MPKVTLSQLSTVLDSFIRAKRSSFGQSGLTVALIASPDELLFWQVDATRYGQQEHQVDRKPAFTNVFESPQSIQVRRVGDDIAIVVGSTETSMNFRSPVPTNVDVSTVAMWVNTGGAPAELAIELAGIRMEADQFANDVAAPSAASSWTILLWSFVAMFGLVGAFWFRQTLRQG